MKHPRLTIAFLFIVAALPAICATGCIPAGAKTLIGDQADNAAEVAARVAIMEKAPNDAPVPMWLADWVSANAQSWAAWDTYANGDDPAKPTTQPPN